jgi:endonuclease YncB( thermonuclease family)
MFCCPALASQQISGKAFVLDGDSLNINKQQIRLNGIDAPEYSQQCLDKNSQLYSCGLNSKNFLINLVKGKIVDCYYDKLDIYKRILATCYVQNLNINNHLLANGMVVIYDFNYATQQQIQLETSAKEQQKGIWQGSFQLPKTYRKSKKKYDKN